MTARLSANPRALTESARTDFNVRRLRDGTNLGGTAKEGGNHKRSTHHESAQKCIVIRNQSLDPPGE